ncbi:MAG: hypothetical protein ACM31C_09310 [Acidobacteriota bacterium]
MRTSTLLAVVLVTACGTSLTQTQINQPPHAMSPRPAASVEILSSGPPTRPHVDVAILQAQQQAYSLDDQADMIAKLRGEAARLGCDALVINGPDNGAAGTRDTTWTLHGYFATCIAYTDMPPALAHR